jgi:hypothetical protein
MKDNSRLRKSLSFVGVALGVLLLAEEIFSFTLYSSGKSYQYSPGSLTIRNHLNICTLALSSFLILLSLAYGRGDRRTSRILSASFLISFGIYLLGFHAETLASGYLHFHLSRQICRFVFYLNWVLSLWITLGTTDEIIVPRIDSLLRQHMPSTVVNSLKGVGGVTLLHISLAVIALFPVFTAPTKKTAPGPDLFQMLWNLWWFHESLFVRGGNPFFCDSIFAFRDCPTTLLFHT